MSIVQCTYIHISTYWLSGYIGGVLLSLWSLVQTSKAIRQQQSTLYCIKNPLIKGRQLLAKYSHRMRYYFKIFRIELSREPTKYVVSLCGIHGTILINPFYGRKWIASRDEYFFNLIHFSRSLFALSHCWRKIK